MERVYASDEIVGLIEQYDIPSKVRKFSKYVSDAILGVSVLNVLLGILLFIGGEAEQKGIGIVIALSGLVGVVSAYLFEHLGNAVAIITEAASIYVLKHKVDDNNNNE